MNIENIKDIDYPGTFQAADKASNDAQKYYKVIISVDLITMIIAASITIYNYSSIESKQCIYIISGLMMFTGLILSVIVLTKKYEDTWYQGRALAESCKTLSWRFMTRSELFESDISNNEAENRFVNRISSLSGEFNNLHQVMDAKLLSKVVITNLMKKVRNSSLDERKAYYIENRLENQKVWYANNATSNKRDYNIWFGIIIISQALSIVSIVSLIVSPASNWNFVGLFTTIAASAISWLQLQRHQELKQAYTTAAHELSSIVALSNTACSEVTFSKFVLDSENAISREHTMWLAQKRSK